MLSIDIVEGRGGAEQRDYLLRNPHSLAYGNPDFLGLLAGHLDARAGWIEARREGSLAGVLPFLVKSGPGGSVWNSLAFFGSNGGAIQAAPDEEAKIGLIKAFYREAAAAGACAATIVTNPLEEDAADYDRHAERDFLDERIGLITHFPGLGPGEDLMDWFQDPRPRNIRRALKEGVTVAKSTDSNCLGFLYETHIANMHAIGGQAKAESFFTAIPQAMANGDWAVFTASLKGRPIAALLLFYFNKTVEYFTPVIVEEFRGTQALALAIYDAMKDAMACGYANWNWGGTWLTQGGVYDFKKRWYTKEYRYYYHTRLFDRSLLEQTPVWLQKHYRGFFVVPYKELIPPESVFYE